MTTKAGWLDSEVTAFVAQEVEARTREIAAKLRAMNVWKSPQTLAAELEAKYSLSPEKESEL